MRTGDSAPDFQLPDQDGNPVRLSDVLAKGPVVLFFYPRAFTPGCTAESCAFRDAGDDLHAAGAARLGISADPVERQHAFAERYALGYPVLSDTDRSVARAYGVKRPGPLFNKRTTFVIDTDATVLGVVHSELSMHKHVEEALAVLRAR